MKYLNTLLLVLALAIFPLLKLSAQCEPDTANCEDSVGTVFMCPRLLPEVNVNEHYDEVITVIPPGTYDYLGNVINIEYIIVDSIGNLPPGIEYFPNAEVFYPDTAYCVQIVGTPTEAGRFPLSITVSAFVYLGPSLIAVQIVDDTSVVMTVHWPAGLDPYKINQFQVLPSAPNPFSEKTRLGFYTPFDDHIKLQVYNILGKLMHEEMLGAPPGEHYFDFTGGSLNPGTYFYRVTNNSDLFTGKFIKSR
jgi:hypothetical protein